MTKPMTFASSGPTRQAGRGRRGQQASVASGIAAAPWEAEILLVHDGARPLVTDEIVAATIAALDADPSADGSVIDSRRSTLSRSQTASRYRTSDRSKYWTVQTPQTFRASALRDAYALAEADEFLGTDDAQVVEHAGGRVLLVEAHATTSGHGRRGHRLGRSDTGLQGRRGSFMTLRIGSAMTFTAFAEGRRLVLGGVESRARARASRSLRCRRFSRTLLPTRSWARWREGDIGKRFPDRTRRSRTPDSLELLAQVGELVRERGYRIVDADCVLVLEQPKISPHRDRMRSNLAAALGVPVDALGLKATTTERLGFAGREEGVAAHAVVLLESVEAAPGTAGGVDARA